MSQGVRIGIAIGLLPLLSLIPIWQSGSLFPWIQVIIAIGILFAGAGVIILSKQEAFQCGLTASILIGIFCRLIIFHTPASLIGNDPDKYAVLANLTLVRGSSFIPGLQFYGIAAGFHTLIAEVAAVIGMTTAAAMQIWSLIYGLLLPLLAVAFVRCFFHRSSSCGRGAATAALLASVATMGVKMSYWPVAQTLATILFTFTVFLFVSWDSRYQERYILLVLIFAVTMVLTHKLTLLIATVVIMGLWILTRYNKYITKRLIQGERSAQITLPLAIIFVGLSSIQLVFITNYLSQGVVLAKSVLFGDFGIPVRHGRQPLAAVVPSLGTLDIFFHHSHALALLPVAGFAWLLILIWVSRHEIVDFTQQAILCITAILVGFIGLSLGGAVSPTSIQPMRIFALAELLLVSIIGIGVTITEQYDRTGGIQLRYAALFFIVAILVIQIGSASLIPDYPGDTRDYLTADEVVGKEFASQYTDSVATDDWYLREVVHPEQVTQLDDGRVVLGRAPRSNDFVSWNTRLVNGTSEAISKPILIRDMTIYPTPNGGFSNYRYQLTWNPRVVLSVARGKVYSNGGATLYTSPENISTK